MKWRLAPNLNLDIIQSQRVVIIGAGTLGCNVSRGLLVRSLLQRIIILFAQGWGIKNITFVDCGFLSYSNCIRQSLYTFNQAFVDGAVTKSAAAARAIKDIYPESVPKRMPQRIV